MSKSYGRIWMKLGRSVGSVMRTNRLNFSSGPDADPAHQWDTKRKLIILADVCTLLSARLVCFGFVISATDPVVISFW